MKTFLLAAALAVFSIPALAVELERDEGHAVTCEISAENVHFCRYPTPDDPKALCISAGSVEHNWRKLAAYLNARLVRPVPPSGFLLALAPDYQQGWTFIDALDRVCLAVTFRELPEVS